MTKVIGFVGKKGAGKDTAADALLEEGWARVRFSQALKEITAQSFDIKPLFLEDAAFKDMEFEKPIKIEKSDVENFLDNLPLSVTPTLRQEIMTEMIHREFTTPRTLLQYLGTDIVRNMIDINGWVKIAADKIQEWRDRGVNVVLTDVRFQNEADVITNANGKLVRINRETDSNDTHESEKQDFTVDIEINNDGSVYDLHRKVRELL